MGHLAPQLPIARALAAAGHEVAFSTYFPMAANVEAAGFAALATGPPVVKPPVQKPLLEPDREREDEVMRTVFAGRLTRERLASVPEHVEAFRPDALVCDETDFGAQIAAGRLGLPFATVLIGCTGAFPRRETIATALAAMPAPPDLVLCGVPPGLRRAPLPDRVLAGLEGFDVIETITRFVAQADVLPRCRAVVSHGGSGTFVATLAHGLPSVLIPLGADQLVNAERAAELGVARVLPAVGATPDDVREAVLEVTGDPAYAAAARAIREEIAVLPGPESAVQPLTRLQSRRVIET